MTGSSKDTSVRMVVHAAEPDKGGRHKFRAYCKMLDPRAPFVSLTLTILVTDETNLPYRVGDEFDLKLGPPL